jgi:hypothetical protein
MRFNICNVVNLAINNSFNLATGFSPSVVSLSFLKAFDPLTGTNEDPLTPRRCSENVGGTRAWTIALGRLEEGMIGLGK